MIFCLKCRSGGFTLYDTRDSAFSDSGVLQENVVFHAVKAKPSKFVAITSSAGADHEMTTLREAPYEEVVRADDPEGLHSSQR